jgi:hypothetical protein
MDYLVVALLALPLLATLAVAFFFPPVRNRLGLKVVAQSVASLGRPRAPRLKPIPPQYVVRNGQIELRKTTGQPRALTAT